MEASLGSSYVKLPKKNDFSLSKLHFFGGGEMSDKSFYMIIKETKVDNLPNEII